MLEEIRNVFNLIFYMVIKISFIIADKLNRLYHNLAIALIDTYLREMKTYSHKTPRKKESLQKGSGDFLRWMMC